MEKQIAIAALERLKDGTSGIVAATISDCQRVIGDLPDATGWIPVTERLPEESCNCLVYTVGGYITLVPYSAVHKMFNAFDDNFPGEAADLAIGCTHWMPLPEPPKEDA